MKNNLITAFIVILVAVGVWFIKKPSQTNLTPIPTNEMASNAVASQTAMVTQPAIAISAPTTNTLTASPILTATNIPELVLTQYRNLDDLKQIKSLKLIDTNINLWCSEGRLITIKINGHDGKTAMLNVDFITALLLNSTDGHFKQLELHSPQMNIDEVRKIGLELDDAWGLDPTEFLAWCDKVGNKQFDQPSFSSKKGVPPSPSQYIAFGVRGTINNVNPWYVRVVIQDR